MTAKVGQLTAKYNAVSIKRERQEGSYINSKGIWFPSPSGVTMYNFSTTFRRFSPRWSFWTALSGPRFCKRMVEKERENSCYIAPLHHPMQGYCSPAYHPGRVLCRFVEVTCLLQWIGILIQGLHAIQYSLDVPGDLQ